MGGAIAILLGLAVPLSAPGERVPTCTGSVRPGPGVTDIRRLSSYLPSLRGTAGDTAVYLMEGRLAGATALVVAGTHGNEVAGSLAAVVLIERARVEVGRLVVIPYANASAANLPERRGPPSGWFEVATASGRRRFCFGSRFTRPEDQGEADPERFLHPASPIPRAGEEARNLDRAYPGRPDGNLTQRVAAGIMEVLRSEGATIAVDLHEAGPESRLAWMVVANPASLDVAAGAILELEANGIAMKLERSSETFRGLSHREWGDATGAMTFLVETPNPCQAETVCADPVNDPSLPLARRVGVQLETIRALLAAVSATGGGGRLEVRDVPALEALVRGGIGAHLQ